MLLRAPHHKLIHVIAPNQKRYHKYLDIKEQTFFKMPLSKLPAGLPVQLWGLLINSTMQYVVSFCVITE